MERVPTPKWMPRFKDLCPQWTQLPRPGRQGRIFLLFFLLSRKLSNAIIKHAVDIGKPTIPNTIIMISKSVICATSNQPCIWINQIFCGVMKLQK